MTVPNEPRPSLPSARGHADDAVRPPWPDRRYLYPHAWQSGLQPGAGPSAHADAWRAAELLGVVAQSRHEQAGVHAVIGDELRMPAVWCELGSCISRFTDAAALGESDVRSRALAVGWRQDALDRLACPSCVQHDPKFRTSYPIVPWLARYVPPPGALPAGQLPAPTEVADTGTSSQPPLGPAMARDEAKRRPSRFRHREAGRHRLTL